MANIETHMEEKAEMKTRKGAKKEKQKKDTTNRGSPEPNIIEDKIEGEAEARVGEKRKVVMHCEHYLPAARVVAASDLVLTMPFSLAHYISSSLPVRLFRLPFQCDPLSVRMYWRAESSDEPYMVWLKSRVNRALDSSLPAFDL